VFFLPHRRKKAVYSGRGENDGARKGRESERFSQTKAV